MTKVKKSVLAVLVLGSVALVWGALTAGTGANQLKPGDVFPLTQLRNIHGKEVVIPDSQSRWVHLQFRRFAGCPICNLHLRSFVTRSAEIRAAGIREVVVFHSPDSSLLPYQGNFPFDVIGDPEKKLYRQFGVQSSVYAILNPGAWPAMFKSQGLEDRPTGDPEGGALGLPADILVSADGKVVASHYGKHSYDQWSVDELLALTGKP